MKRKHLTPQKIITTSQASRKRKFMRHIIRKHNCIRPSSIFGCQFINLEPRTDSRSGSGISDGSEKVVLNWSWVGGAIPLNFDGVSGVGWSGSFSGWDSIAIYVASDVVACYVGLEMRLVYVIGDSEGHIRQGCWKVACEWLLHNREKHR